MKKDIIRKIEEVLNEGDMVKIVAEIRELRSSYNEASKTLEEENKKQFIEAGGNEEDYAPQNDEDDKAFMELMTRYNSLKKSFDQDTAKREEDNLAIKVQLIEDLKLLISNETNIAKAYQELKEIRAKWDATGNIPKAKFKEIQHEFSLQLEYFYYNINIYKTLKAYDLEKNLRLKKELIKKMEGLLHVESIKEIKERVELLIGEWDAVGPTFKEQWQEVRDRFWEAAAKVHLKIKEHFGEQKEKQKENLEAKKELCERVERINKMETNSEKAWRKRTKEILDIQEKWKTIGFATKKQNDKIWQRFRAALDVFFEHKKSFFGDLKGEYEENEKRKMALIAEAEQLKGETDWKSTTEAFVKLQRRWKDIGHTGRQKESRLWNKFNEICNEFFQAKKKYYDTLDDRLDENFNKKLAIIEKIKAYKLLDDKKKNIEQLRAFTLEWNEVGFVARDKKDKIQAEFDKAIDEHYSKMNLDRSEKEKAKFNNRIAALHTAKNAPELIQRERGKLRERIRRLEVEVVHLENNLGFFESSTGDNPFFKQAEQKVEGAREELQKLKDQLKLVR